MVDPKDVHVLKMVRAELARRAIDISRADVHVHHGIVTIRGTVAATPLAEFHDIDEEMTLIRKVLCQRPDVRDVVLEILIVKAR